MSGIPAAKENGQGRSVQGGEDKDPVDKDRQKDEASQGVPPPMALTPTGGVTGGPSVQRGGAHHSPIEKRAIRGISLSSKR
jgi:hypothetical protein